MQREDKGSKGRFNPVRLADEANDEFVRMVQMLARLLTWDFAPSQQGGAGAAALDPADEAFAGADRPRATRPPGGLPPLDPQTWNALARRIEQIVSQTGIGRDAAADADLSVSQQTLPAGLREIFHHDAARRLRSVQQIRRDRQTDALPLLRAVLAVEEDTRVKQAIEGVLAELDENTESVEARR